MTTAASDIGPYAIVPKWVADALVGSPAALALYHRLALMADRDTGQAWPSRSYLARMLGCSVDSIDRLKRDLQAVGAISVEARKGPDGSPTSNVYTVHFAQGVAARMRLGSRTDAAGGGRTGAALTRTTTELELPPVAPQGGRRRRQRRPLAEDERLADFNAWYAAYPKKAGKLDAQQAWRNALDALPDTEALIAAVRSLSTRTQLEHRMAADWTRYMPNPATWLNGHRWDDEVTAEAPPRSVGPCAVCGSSDPRERCLGVGKGLLAEEGDCPWRS